MLVLILLLKKRTALLSLKLLIQCHLCLLIYYNLNFTEPLHKQLFSISAEERLVIFFVNSKKGNIYLLHYVHPEHRCDRDFQLSLTLHVC